MIKPTTKKENIRFIAYMLHALRKKGSWCGIWQIQKSCYIAQEMLGVKLDYEFFDCRHGPHSFDLHEDVEFAVNRFILDAKKNPGNADSFFLYDEIEKYVEKKEYEHAEKVKFIADWFGDRCGLELEKITAVYMVTRKLKADSSEKEQRKELKNWKESYLTGIESVLNEIAEKEAALA